MEETRRTVILGIFGAVGLVFLVKLLSIQVLSDTYQEKAEENAIQKVVIQPHRGMIYDRNGKLLVYNKPIFSILVVPSEVELEDTLAFCEIVGITKEEFDEKMEKARQINPRKPSIFLKQIQHTEFAAIQDKLMDFKGFYVDFRTIRSYPHTSLAHALGYIGEITKERLEKDTTHQYRQGDYVGISGLEAAYEYELRGRLGVKYVLVDVNGSFKGSYKNAAYDTLAIAGKDLISTIDLELQQYGDLLMTGKRGSIVAIEPATGEVLAMVSSPSYDPNLLVVGNDFAKNYTRLANDPLKPLYNRTIMGMYPPGSTFKVVEALVGLQEGVLIPSTRLRCDQSLVKCHGHPSPANVHQSIQYSCNPYYFKVFRRIVYQNKIVRNDSIFKELPDGDGKIGFNIWKDYMLKFGLGRRMAVDLVNVGTGRIPDLAYYNKKYGAGNWEFNNVYSLGIGQGELAVLPIQMANIAAIIANKGFFYTPHLVKSIGEQGKRPEYLIRQETGIDKSHFELVISAMRDAVRAGTVSTNGIPYNIKMCGKTGTVQNPHGKDHSVFIAFAPMDEPKIAIAVYVENAGFGGVWAAPIASLMIEKYLLEEVKRQGVEKTIVATAFK